MIAHPITLSIVFVDSLSVVTLSVAAFSSVRILSGWEKASCSEKQLYLERLTEFSDLITSLSFLLLFISSLILIYSIVNVLPGMISGAMCGSGVFEACKGFLKRGFIYRIIALALLYLHVSLSRLGKRAPHFDLTQMVSRITLLSLPFIVLSAIETFRAFMQINEDTPVNCCSIVYDMVKGSDAGPVNANPLVWLYGYLGVALLLGTGGVIYLLKAEQVIKRTWSRVFFVSALLWIPMAVYTLRTVFSAAYFEVLQHDCLWCLFSKEQWGAGYFLFGALVLLGVKSISGLVMSVAIKKDSPYCEHCKKYIDRTVRYIIFLMMFFLVLSAIPALWWRFRFGLWL